MLTLTNQYVEPRRTIVVPGDGSNSLSFTLPPGVTISVEAVYVDVDATAAGDTTATLTLTDGSGVVIARKAQSETITAGGTGSATWALRLDDKGGGGALGNSVVSETAFGQAPTAGTSPLGSRDDHTHGTPATPVTSLAASGSPGLVGAVTLSAGAGASLVQAGQDIQVSVAGALTGAFTIPPLQSGHWYGTPFAGAPGTAALSQGILHATPLYVPNAVTLDAIGFNGTPTGAFNVRLGIYADNGFGFPDALVLDAGVVANASGQRTIAISQALAAGLYWLVIVNQGGTNTINGVAAIKSIVHSTNLSDYTSGGGGTAYRLTGITGTLPSPYGTTLLVQNTATTMLAFVRVV